MAIRDDIIASLVEAIAALNRRIAELSAAQPVAGPPGEQGPPGEPGRDAPPLDEATIRAMATAWLEANITQPADGQPGADGQDGQPGRPPTADEISLAVDLWLELNRESLRGPPGRDGQDGADGRDGTDGRDGRPGDRGAAGRDGVGIDTIEQRKAGQFTVTLTDGRSFDLKLPVPLGAGGGGNGPHGQAFYGSFYDMTSQAPTATNVATPIIMGVADVVNGVKLADGDPTKIVVAHGGIYNLQWSGQFENSQVEEADVHIWARINGVDVAGSNGRVSVPARHGFTNGHSIIGWNYYLRLQPGDAVQLIWLTEDDGVIIEAYAAQASPAIPATASVIATISRVGT